MYRMCVYFYALHSTCIIKLKLIYLILRATFIFLLCNKTPQLFQFLQYYICWVPKFIDEHRNEGIKCHIYTKNVFSPSQLIIFFFPNLQWHCQKTFISDASVKGFDHSNSVFVYLIVIIIILHYLICTHDDDIMIMIIRRMHHIFSPFLSLALSLSTVYLYKCIPLQVVSSLHW